MNENNKEEQTINDSFEISEKELEELRNKAREKAKSTFHQWRQKGPYIVCKSCEYHHGFYIGVDKVLVGIDKKGMPILKDRKG